MKYTLGRWRVLAPLAAVLALLLGGRALAAEVYSGNTYVLPAGEVLEDDLYVTAEEVIIDGTVVGDVVAAGGRIVINGTVSGDLLAAGGSVQVSGTIEDDVRAAGGAIDINGTIGGDLMAAGGGGMWSPPLTFGGQQVEQGVRVSEAAAIGGDAYIAGGEGAINGSIGGDLHVTVIELAFAGEVGRNAELMGQTLRIGEGAQVNGSLRYSAPEQQAIPQDVAQEIVYVAPESSGARAAERPASNAGWWLVRTLLVLLGFALLTWLTLRFAPRAATAPAAALERQPGRAALYGLLAALLLLFVPLVSALLVFLMVLFFGWLAGVVTALVLFGALALLWVLSPLVVGMWIGQRLAALRDQPRQAVPWLIAGVLLVALLARVPVLGWLVGLVSFILALGAILLAWRTGAEPAAAGAS
ncbi:MAG: hypothetical protein DIU80_011005 [Chloroflexota bacterium]